MSGDSQRLRPHLGAGSADGSRSGDQRAAREASGVVRGAERVAGMNLDHLRGDPDDCRRDLRVRRLRRLAHLGDARVEVDTARAIRTNGDALVRPVTRAMLAEERRSGVAGHLHERRKADSTIPPFRAQILLRRANVPICDTFRRELETRHVVPGVVETRRLHFARAGLRDEACSSGELRSSPSRSPWRAGRPAARARSRTRADRSRGTRRREPCRSRLRDAPCACRRPCTGR